MKAKHVIMMAWGEGKASVIKKAVEGPVSDHIPSSFLQRHGSCQVILDDAASSELSRIKTPWILDTIDWNDTLIRKAVVWLCQKMNKPVLKLTNHDYMEHGMGDIITEYGSAYQVNIKIFNHLQHTPLLDGQEGNQMRMIKIAQSVQSLSKTCCNFLTAP